MTGREYRNLIFGICVSLFPLLVSYSADAQSQEPPEPKIAAGGSVGATWVKHLRTDDDGIARHICIQGRLLKPGYSTVLLEFGYARAPWDAPKFGGQTGGIITPYAGDPPDRSRGKTWGLGIGYLQSVYSINSSEIQAGPILGLRRYSAAWEFTDDRFSGAPSRFYETQVFLELRLSLVFDSQYAIELGYLWSRDYSLEKSNAGNRIGGFNVSLFIPIAVVE